MEAAVPIAPADVWEVRTGDRMKTSIFIFIDVHQKKKAWSASEDLSFVIAITY